MAARAAAAASWRSASLISHLHGRRAVGVLASPATRAPLSATPTAAGVVGALPGSRRFLETNSRTVPVSPGGSLRLRIRQACHLRVRVADVHTSPWDQVVVSLDVSATPPGGRAEDGGGGKATPRVMSADAAAAVSNDFGMHVYCDSERNTVTVDSEAESTPHWLARLAHQVSSWVGGPFRRANPSLDAAVTLTLTIPGKFHVDVELEEGTCTVDGTLEGNFRFVSSAADLVASRLKSGYVDIDAGDGDVSAGVVQGHATLRTGAGNVDVGRLQGPFIGVHTGSGDIQARSVYATYASIRTVDGGVRLGTAAGNLHIRCSGEGEVEMGGVTGALDVETDEGDVEVQLAAPGRVAVASARGDVELAVGGGRAVSGVGVCLEAGGEGGVALSDSVRLLRVGGESRHSVRGVLQGGLALDPDREAIVGAGSPLTPAAGLAAATAAAADADAGSPAEAPHIWVRAAAGDVRLTTREWAASFVGGEGTKPAVSSSTTATAAAAAAVAAAAPPQGSSPEGTPLWGGRPFPRWARAYPPPCDDTADGGGGHREPATPAPTPAPAAASAAAGSGRA
ncbi:hypothetical protein MMPV_008505 [Pyropia vietnamensis]